GYWQQYHCKNQLPGKLHSHILSEKSGLKRNPPSAENLGMFVSERFDINQVGKSCFDPTLSIAPALRVAPGKAPLGIARHSFGATKLRSSRLDWRFFRHNRAHPISVNRP
ncbi:MAG: hypothetical protein JAY73_02365, partial [Candidatus Thiodiazotropha taylori]|nr:hypothetical protein [Candidatus Thiodiazotropha taylori]